MRVCLCVALLTAAMGGSAQANEIGRYDNGYLARAQSVTAGSADRTSQFANLSIPDIAKKICRTMYMYNATKKGSGIDAFEFVVLRELKLDKEKTPNYRQVLRDFWNAHHDQLICKDEVDAFPSPQHVLKRIVESDDMSEFYQNSFFDTKDLNVNTVEYHNGNPETLLDFLGSGFIN